MNRNRKEGWGVTAEARSRETVTSVLLATHARTHAHALSPSPLHPYSSFFTDPPASLLQGSWGYTGPPTQSRIISVSQNP